MTRLLPYAPALFPLAAAVAIAGLLLPRTDPIMAWAVAALVASVMFVVLMLVRPQPRRRARPPLSMSDLVRVEPAIAEAAIEPADAPLVSPEVDQALRQTLDELRRLARA